jgi:hypothetical protein
VPVTPERVALEAQVAERAIGVDDLLLNDSHDPLY